MLEESLWCFISVFKLYWWFAVSHLPSSPSSTYVPSSLSWCSSSSSAPACLVLLLPSGHTNKRISQVIRDHTTDVKICCFNIPALWLYESLLSSSVQKKKKKVDAPFPWWLRLYPWWQRLGRCKPPHRGRAGFDHDKRFLHPDLGSKPEEERCVSLD